MKQDRVVVIDAVVVEQDMVFSLADLCRACGAERAQLLALVDEGVLVPQGDSPPDWRFRGPALRTARTALRLARELELGLAGTAMVLDLLTQIEDLRAQLRRSGGA